MLVTQKEPFFTYPPDYAKKTEDHEKQSLATLKRLKHGDEHGVGEKTKTGEGVTNRYLRLTVEMEEEEQ